MTVPRRIYYCVFVTLLVLTLLTWGVSYVPMRSSLHILVALTIAISKACLVLFFFMHVRYSGWLTWVFVGTGIAFLGHMLILTMSDYVTRSMVSGW